MDDPAILQHLRQLMDAQLIDAVSAEAFAFRHVLTREAVYATILKRQRAAYHALAADALEELYRAEAELSEHASELAYHYREAADWPKALAYARQAAEQAQQRYAPREAAEHFSRALEAAKELGQPLSLELLRGRGQAYETLGDFERARADLELGLALARQAGVARSEWQALLDLGFLWGGRDYAQSGVYFQQALGLARVAGDPLTIAHSLNHVGLARQYRPGGRRCAAPPRSPGDFPRAWLTGRPWGDLRPAQPGLHGARRHSHVPGAGRKGR